MPSLTLSIVLPISIIGSIPKRTATKPTGKFKAESVIKAAFVAPPPTPAIPKLPIAIIIITFIKK